MTGITVLKSNIPHGPFTRAEIAQKLAAGEITPDSLAFVEGLAQWTPLRDVLAKVDSAPSPHAPIGTGFGIEQKPAALAQAVTGYSYATTMAPPGHLVYAGFWMRFAAWFIDYLIVYAAFMVVFFGLCFVFGLAAGFSAGLSGSRVSDPDLSAHPVAVLLYMSVLLVFVVMRWLYFAFQESSRYQATLGKRALGLQVTDRMGQRLGFGRATGRYFAKIISGLPFCIGFMMAGWTERKQALHDMIADSLVVRKPGA